MIIFFYVNFSKMTCHFECGLYSQYIYSQYYFLFLGMASIPIFEHGLYSQYIYIYSVSFSVFGHGLYSHFWAWPLFPVYFQKWSVVLGIAYIHYNFNFVHDIRQVFRISYRKSWANLFFSLIHFWHNIHYVSELRNFLSQNSLVKWVSNFRHNLRYVLELRNFLPQSSYYRDHTLLC